MSSLLPLDADVFYDRLEEGEHEVALIKCVFQPAAVLPAPMYVQTTNNRFAEAIQKSKEIRTKSLVIAYPRRADRS